MLCPVAQPLVSVIIPTFNRASQMHVSVESVIAQSHRPIELIVIDDGSSDETQSKMSALEAKVREAGIAPVFLRKENGGCASARNLGLQRATGDWIAFLDDDDHWTTGKLARQLARLAETGASACSAQALKRMPKGERVIPATGEELIQGHEPGRFLDGRSDGHLITIVFRRDLLARVGEFDTSLRVSSDTEWIARLCHVAEFCAVPEVLATYEYTPGALSRLDDLQAELKRDEVRQRQLMLIREKCSVLPGWDETAWRRRASRQYSEMVKHRLYVGDVPGARRVFEEGMALSGGTQPLPRVKRKLLKARVLGPFGWRLKHPKLDQS
jgi:glycosyltransferase involved in cell wall biosynthesis